MKIRSPHSAALALIAMATTFAWVTHAWQLEAPFNTSVHEHGFHRLAVARVGDSCQIDFRLSFDAPRSGYASAEVGRNYYRFRARAMLTGGRKVLSPEFGNRAPGKRVYRWRHDTSDEGCWAADPQKVFAVDIEGCRNRNCRIAPFR